MQAWRNGSTRLRLHDGKKLKDVLNKTTGFVGGEPLGARLVQAWRNGSTRLGLHDSKKLKESLSKTTGFVGTVRNK